MGGNINDGMTTTCLILGPSAVDKIDNSLNSSVVRISDNKSDLASYLPTNSSQQIVEIVVSATDLLDYFDPMAVSGIVSNLSTLKIRVLNGASTDLGVVNIAFILSGLTPESERKEQDGSTVFVARKQNFDHNTSSAQINLYGSSSEEEKKSEIEPPLRPVKIRIDLDDDFGDEDEDDMLIDEDNLLYSDTENEMLAPPSMDISGRSKIDDCGGRKACDDCTCGRAEKEAGIDVKPKQPLSSACGNCSKGDAFRCAGCPFLGRPAFKSGEEHLVLDLADDL
mmetsp:Transcript_8949/g.11187  ORF Transcript_8949/g.11187 Transcript_8949/m.11187 type:complete len:281 (-) Transcript_8949:122-964(-)|eukprot:CAMPEP_0194378538 /NCGR_PEP_ID=MMETSP0174-20130528/35940_1 /TAXON_ID=216777 /ORGANISM="Proboscia alata, Strain PI-D3" /LENGTH=280 /DNA_ID=CAMNT_0039160643 /DNA_START=40 /DNA_END=882 /DNA_ORIENTATION=-